MAPPLPLGWTVLMGRLANANCHHRFSCSTWSRSAVFAISASTGWWDWTSLKIGWFRSILRTKRSGCLSALTLLAPTASCSDWRSETIPFACERLSMGPHPSGCDWTRDVTEACTGLALIRNSGEPVARHQPARSETLPKCLALKCKSGPSDGLRAKPVFIAGNSSQVSAA